MTEVLKFIEKVKTDPILLRNIILFVKDFPCDLYYSCDQCPMYFDASYRKGNKDYTCFSLFLLDKEEIQNEV